MGIFMPIFLLHLKYLLIRSTMYSQLTCRAKKKINLMNKHQAAIKNLLALLNARLYEKKKRF